MFPQVGIVQHRTARVQCEQGSPGGRLGWSISASFFQGPRRDTFLLLAPSYLGLLGWGLMQGMGDFSFLNTFSAFAFLSSFSLFVSDICKRCVRWGRSGWSGYHRDNWSRAPSVGHKQGGLRVTRPEFLLEEVQLIRSLGQLRLLKPTEHLWL